jgi:hypothetical protein
MLQVAYGLQPTSESVYGVLALIAWSLILIVSLKYLIVIIRLDNRGEGGIMALLAMLPRIRSRGVFKVTSSARLLLPEDHTPVGRTEESEPDEEWRDHVEGKLKQCGERLSQTAWLWRRLTIPLVPGRL